MKAVLRNIGSTVLESYFGCWAEEGQPEPPSYVFTDAIIQGLKNCSGIVEEALGMQDEDGWILPCYEGGDDSEYLCDFTLTTTYYRTGRDSAYRKHQSRRCGVLLAAESELKGCKDIDEVFRDFWKLTDIKAAIKVMVYTYRKDCLPAIRYGFEKILTDHYRKDKTEDWLFLGLPWPGEWHEYAIDTLEWDGDRASLVSETVDLLRP
jgi:hypothetical protein